LTDQDPSNIGIEDILVAATRIHAAHLTKAKTAALLTASRLSLFPLNPPALQSSSDLSRPPLALHIPLPSRHRASDLVINVSSKTGLVDISDTGANAKFGNLEGNETGRAGRVRLACASVNEGKTRLPDDIGRLIIAVGS
jgi:mediator of RNA polymerase II transcription subunit 14